jgi:hypothetical protein
MWRPPTLAFNGAATMIVFRALNAFWPNLPKHTMRG